MGSTTGESDSYERNESRAKQKDLKLNAPGRVEASFSKMFLS